MSTTDDLRDLRDALDCIAHGALPRWGTPTTKTGEEAQTAARKLYEKFVRALHHESAAKAAVEKSLSADDQHRTHSEILTNRIEKLEAESTRLRERMSDMEDGLRYGEKACAALVSERDEIRARLRGESAHIRSLEGLLVEACKERDEARSQVKAWQAEELARRTERDEARSELDLMRSLGPKAHEAHRQRDQNAALAESLRGELEEAHAQIKALQGLELSESWERDDLRAEIARLRAEQSTQRKPE